MDRSYTRSRNTKSERRFFVVVCEGARTEPMYLEPYEKDCSLKDRSLRNTVKVEKTLDGENNTPKGLLSKAKGLKHNLGLGKKDQLWIVFDRDQNNVAEIKSVKQAAASAKISVAESNPCFEVWLYYHYKSEYPTNAPMTQTGWKTYLGQQVGSVDYSECRHLVQSAINNVEGNRSSSADESLGLYDTECDAMMKTLLSFLST